LKVKPMGRGIAWLDTGTAENLLQASSFVHALQTRQGLVIGSPEEVAVRMGYIDAATFRARVEAMPRSAYRSYLERILPEVEHA
ncbi:MAG: glucose-1-phosphate thymidylyltransferase, partial [Myxococcota bacterium]